MHSQVQQYWVPTENIDQNALCLSSTEKSFVNEDRNQRYEIAKLLRGQKVGLPNFHQIFEGWPSATSLHLDSLRVAVDEKLKRTFPPGKRRSKLIAADIALFGAMWWHYASWERLCIATNLSIWLFAWDDEIDSTEFSELSMNWQEAQIFRTKMMERVRTDLALDHTTSFQNNRQTATRSSIIEQFASIGHALIEHYTLDQRQALMRQIKFFVDMCEVEQRTLLDEKLSSVESYQRRRMGTSAVFVCLAIHEYTLNMRLPQNVMLHPMMQMLWEQTNIIISVSNDILSLKKEVAQNRVDSLVPLLYVTHNHELQAAMNEAGEILSNSVTRFDFAAKRLLEIVDDQTMTADVARFIDSCRYACTANLNWSLRSGRYDLQNMDFRRGDINLQI